MSRLQPSALQRFSLLTLTVVCLLYLHPTDPSHRAYAGGPAGALRFASGGFQVGEGEGSASLTVQRIGGDNGEVSVQYRTSDGSAMAGSDYTGVVGTLTWPDGDDDPRFISVPILEDGQVEGTETVLLNLINPTGGATLGSPATTTLMITDNDAPQNPGTLGFALGSYEAGEGDGNATITVQRLGGADGAVSVDYATLDGSARAGSDYVATAGTLAWASGDASTKIFTVPILDDEDPEDGETLNLSLRDPTGGAGLGAAVATLTILDDDVVTGPCIPDGETLCLGQGGRFRVQVAWRDPFGNAGQGQAVAIGRRDSGLFFFFNENNIEMLVKVLDACALPAFESYWVFYAATTNVEFTLTVTDTVADQQKQYFNPLNNPAEPVQDTRAFRTCS